MVSYWLTPLQRRWYNAGGVEWASCLLMSIENLRRHLGIRHYHREGRIGHQIKEGGHWMKQVGMAGENYILMHECYEKYDYGDQMVHQLAQVEGEWRLLPETKFII